VSRGTQSAQSPTFIIIDLTPAAVRPPTDVRRITITADGKGARVAEPARQR
jgi:hypothetical protein